MAFVLEGKKLFDNEWTNAIIQKKEFWSKYASNRGFEITGTYSNMHCEFNLVIPIRNGILKIEGHRNFVDLPNVLPIQDAYNERFCFIYKVSNGVNFPRSRTFKRNLLGTILLGISSYHGYEINDSLVLGCKETQDFRIIQEIGILNLKSLEKVRTGPKGIIFRCNKLFESDSDIQQIDKLIGIIKTLHNK